jgi:hypothetical protein
MNIEYKINALVSAEQFIELLRQSTLGERRLLMIVSAWKVWLKIAT